MNSHSYKQKQVPMDHLVEGIREKLNRPVVIVGMVGAGKSRLGRMLGKALFIPFYDCDAEVEQSAGRSVAEIRAQVGDAALRAAEGRILTRLMSQGVSVIAVGEDFVDMPDMMNKVFTEAVTIWVQADPQVMAHRIARSHTRPGLDSTDLPSYLAVLREKCDPVYARADMRVQSHEGPAVEVLGQAILALHDHLCV